MKINRSNVFIACAGFVLAFGIPAVASAQTAASSSCPIDLGFMKLGADNNSDQVLRLQSYLKDSENLDVDVTGTFDQKTEQAVEAFQKKYLSDVMGPWSATIPSGMVYITTVKKINQLACGIPLSLDPKELGVINTFIATRDSSGTSPATALNSSDSSLTASGVALGPVDLSDQTNGIQQTAAATSGSGGTSLWSRFWGFIGRMFGR